MTDERAKEICGWLREYAKWARRDGLGEREADLRDAADELERLRTENARLQELAVDSQRLATHADANASVERKAKHSAECHVHALEVENAALREALEPFAHVAYRLSPDERSRGWSRLEVQVADLDRAAEVLK